MENETIKKCGARDAYGPQAEEKNATIIGHDHGVAYRGTFDRIGWTAVAQWLRRCATNRKVAGSIQAVIIGIFHWHGILPIVLRPWGRLSL